MKKIIGAVLVLFIFCGSANGDEQQFTAKQHKEQLNAVATAKGDYAQYDRWPKDYFLIPQNLPFMVGLCLYHPGHVALALSEEQKAAIHAIRNRTVPAVLVMAEPIKKKELELADKLVVQKVDPQKLSALVDEISALRAELTKAHMACIWDVQNVLDERQYAALLKVAETVTHHKKKQGVKK